MSRRSEALLLSAAVFHLPLLSLLLHFQTVVTLHFETTMVNKTEQLSTRVNRCETLFGVISGDLKQAHPVLPANLCTEGDL